MLTYDPSIRPSAGSLLTHKWLTASASAPVGRVAKDPRGDMTDLALRKFHEISMATPKPPNDLILFVLHGICLSISRLNARIFHFG